MLKIPMEQVLMNKTDNHQKKKNLTRKLQPFNVKGFKNSKKKQTTKHYTIQFPNTQRILFLYVSLSLVEFKDDL
jgi:hypothetical protein